MIIHFKEEKNSLEKTIHFFFTESESLSLRSREKIVFNYLNASFPFMSSLAKEQDYYLKDKIQKGYWANMFKQTDKVNKQ